MRTFLGIRRKLDFTSAPLSMLQEEMLFNLVHASTAKCVEFNIETNRERKKTESTFILMSNLRGICEDLIWLTYLSKMNKTSANELITLLIGRNYAKAIAVQRNFFEVNNPVQPVLGNNVSRRDAEDSVREFQNKLREFWRSMNCSRSGGPTVREMAEEVGLTSTYAYLYFAASNFVHFNPTPLLATGWGDDRVDDPVFTYSTRCLRGYYQMFSSFYAAILFIGYEASFGQNYFNDVLDVEIGQLMELIRHVHRWPELVTFEEMNVEPPLFFLTHAIGTLAYEEDNDLPFGEIIREVRNLNT